MGVYVRHDMPVPREDHTHLQTFNSKHILNKRRFCDERKIKCLWPFPHPTQLVNIYVTRGRFHIQLN